MADAFGGKLAVVDTQGRTIESVRSLPAHNIRGLAFAPDGRTLVVAHQVLNPLAQTSFDDVHWGLLIRNHLRVLPTSRLLPPYSDAGLLDGSQLFDLGDVGYGGGRPWRTGLRCSRQSACGLGGRRRDRDHREPRSRSASNCGGTPAHGRAAEPRRTLGLCGR